MDYVKTAIKNNKRKILLVSIEYFIKGMIK